MSFNKRAKRFRLGQEDLHLLYRVNDVLIEKSLLKSSDKILVTLSGGQDSTCLIAMFNQFQSAWNWKLAVLHCDHGWHSSSKLQGSHVSHLMISMNLDYYYTVATRPIDKERDARYWRYQISQRIASFHNYTKIVTGHTASDRIETLLFNLIRGSGMHGLQPLNWERSVNYKISSFSFHNNKTSFLPFKNVKQRQSVENVCSCTKHNLQLIRPFLSINRTELKRLCQTWKLPIWPDQTNQYLNINRNRIRNQLLPYLRYSFHKNIDKALSQWAEIYTAETDYLTRLSEYILFKTQIQDFSKKESFSLGLQINLLQVLPISLQRRVLKTFFMNYLQKSLSFNEIEIIRLNLFKKVS